MEKNFSATNDASSIFSLNKNVIFVLLSIFLMTMTTVSTTAYAGGDKDDSCAKKGLKDGKNHPFNQKTFEKCGDIYYIKFIKGCLSVEGNTKDICESAADA